MDHPKRCLGCYYILDGLPAGRCPECGRSFDPAIELTYTTKAPFIWWRFWLPGFLAATIGGAVVYALLITTFGYGLSAAIVTPFVMGIVLGYATRGFRAHGIFMLVVLAVVCLVVILAAGSFLGIFCGLVLGCVALVPAAVGAGVGYVLRQQLKQSNFQQRQWLPIALLWLAPVCCGVVEGRHHYPVETITTSTVIASSKQDAWDGVCFYEQVRHEPPLLLRLLLPKPLYAYGNTGHAGDVTYCIYKKGRLVKRISRAEPGKLLAFDVLQQSKIEVNSVRLTGGAFAFESLGPNLTRVTLSTEYEPLLGPRFAWSWAERWAVHTLHEHVLHGMRMRAAEFTTHRQSVAESKP